MWYCVIDGIEAWFQGTFHLERLREGLLFQKGGGHDSGGKGTDQEIGERALVKRQ